MSHAKAASLINERQQRALDVRDCGRAEQKERGRAGDGAECGALGVIETRSLNLVTKESANYSSSPS